MSWNHTQEYDSAGYQDYASRLGGGQYEKVWDLGAFLGPSLRDINSAASCRASCALSGCRFNCSIMCTCMSA